MTFNPDPRWFQATQILVTLGGFVFAILQLRAEYRWRRQQYAVNMVAEWNNHTAAHRKGIEQALPGLMDRQGPNKDVDLTADMAEQLYFAKHTDKDLWVLKGHCIELLNYCEYIAVSYM